jgi:hypothetical protein
VSIPRVVIGLEIVSKAIRAEDANHPFIEVLGFIGILTLLIIVNLFGVFNVNWSRA